MKRTHSKIIQALALAMAGGFLAVAQSTQSNDVPAPTAYSNFTRFIANRNIFDPNRVAHNRFTSHPQNVIRPRGLPTFSLVGTMAYGKGKFAFFDGTSSEWRKVLPESGSIAGYTVTEITPTSAKLVDAGKKQIEMPVGAMMRQQGGSWQMSGDGQFSGTRSTGAAVAPPVESSGDDTSAGADSSSSGSAPAAPMSDVLKKLMQQRQQQLK